MIAENAKNHSTVLRARTLLFFFFYDFAAQTSQHDFATSSSTILLRLKLGHAVGVGVE
ncbi:uncharacterized protein G2W53_014676 [Senna tora]|uniref:Uncharacterized protein n=1 Tax=Senna tora TaxID=362788 RepID=A0A834WTN1_9FABA|nr:uncharacterized protein G2W53_014676 [Senna tora]